jgi:hypothetical protein
VETRADKSPSCSCNAHAMRDRRKSTMYVGPGNLWKQLWSRLSSTAPALAFACTAFLWGNSFDLAVWLGDPTQLQYKHRSRESQMDFGNLFKVLLRLFQANLSAVGRSILIGLVVLPGPGSLSAVWFDFGNILLYCGSIAYP